MPKRVKLTNGFVKETMDNGTAYFYPPDGSDRLAAATYYTRIKEGKIPKGTTIMSETPDGFIPFPTAQDLQSSGAVNESSTTQSISELSLPDAKSNASRPTSGAKATPKELSGGIQTTLIVGTSLASLFSGIPELAMQQDEAKAIAIPLGNLLEHTEINKKYGRMIADSGDTQLLAYASGQYLFRASKAIGGKINERRRRNESRRTHANSAPGGVADNGAEFVNPGAVSYRPAISGLRAFTRPVEQGATG